MFDLFQTMQCQTWFEPKSTRIAAYSTHLILFCHCGWLLLLTAERLSREGRTLSQAFYSVSVTRNSVGNTWLASGSLGTPSPNRGCQSHLSISTCKDPPSTLTIVRNSLVTSVKPTFPRVPYLPEALCSGEEVDPPEMSCWICQAVFELWVYHTQQAVSR